MLIYPNIDPIAVSFGPIKIHWYGVMYLIGFLGAWILGVYRARRIENGLTKEQVTDLIFYGALGVIVGGRIGYMLFYDLPDFLHHPLSLFAVWNGGMSFHGGLLGVCIAFWLYSRHLKTSIGVLTDFIAPMVPIGLAAGRIGNFINSELWGRVTTSPIGMIFPNAGPLPRYPSQLIEFLFEGVFLFILLWFFSNKSRPRFAVSAVFLLGYGSFRFLCEFFRQPDPQYGYLIGGWITMGQILSLPMVIAGMIALCWIYGRRKKIC